MVRYLSAEWIEALDAAASTGGPRPGADGQGTLTVQHVVTDGGDGHVTFHTVVTDGRMAVRQGLAERPDVTFTSDRETAAAITSGRLSASAAFMSGRLRLGGDVTALLRHGGAFAELDQAYAAVRARTTYH